MRLNLPTKNILLKKNNNSFGFTIIEILVVISITAIVGGVSFAGFAAYSKQQKVEQVARDVKLMLEEARASAINNKKPHFNPGTGLSEPQLCIYDFDKSGNIPFYLFPSGSSLDAFEGYTSTPRSLEGYRLRVDTDPITGVRKRLRLYASCERINPLTPVNVRIKEKILPEGFQILDVSLPQISCYGAAPRQGYYFEAGTGKYRCQDDPNVTQESVIWIQGPESVQRKIVISPQGDDIRIQ